MKVRSHIFIVVVIVMLAAIVFVLVKAPRTEPHLGTGDQTPETAKFDQSISDGTVQISYPSKDFGLATTKEQILVTSYIPPCDENFNYCFYYIGDAYKGTNFESAGLRMVSRTDVSERQCLDMPPAGYDVATAPETTTYRDTYAFSIFPVGDAGAGHSASGLLYRMFYTAKETCYEFETRIGQSQFQNYLAGTIREFTAADKKAVEAMLGDIVHAITLTESGEKVFTK